MTINGDHTADRLLRLKTCNNPHIRLSISIIPYYSHLVKVIIHSLSFSYIPGVITLLTFDTL